MAKRPVYIDIDGTLTTTGDQGYGPVIESRLKAVRDMIASGVQVVLWSGKGEDYVRAFAEKHAINAHAMLGKPGVVIDDCLFISPLVQLLHPDWLDRPLDDWFDRQRHRYLPVVKTPKGATW